MATCKDCIHEELCNIHGYIDAKDCACFKNKADFVEVKHGEWENGMFCSLCGYLYDTGEYTNAKNYCPDCGAKMDGGMAE